MTGVPDGPERYRLWPLSKCKLAALSVIGAITVGIVVCFAYVGGFLSTGRLTQASFIDTFQQLNGPHPGFRRNHAKGVCVEGQFESNGNGARLSKAVVFAPGTIPIIGRFSLAGGMPAASDTPTDVRALAVSFRPPGAEEWRTTLVNIPVFLAKDAAGFRDFLVAVQPDPATGKPDPAKMTAFFTAHPETAKALSVIKSAPFSDGFANASYSALNAFFFVNAAGTSTPVRWSLVAVDPFVAETPDQPVSPDVNYLFDALIDRVEHGPVQWHLVVTIGQPGDPTDDASLPWPADRERVDVGFLTIDHIEAEAPGNCRDVNFDPLVLPAGIAPSDDPLLSARSAAYSTSFTRRAGEEKSPSAVQVPSADKGN